VDKYEAGPNADFLDEVARGRKPLLKEEIDARDFRVILTASASTKWDMSPQE